MRPSALAPMILCAFVVAPMAHCDEAVPAGGAPLFVDVRHDLVSLGIFERNAAGDGETNDSEPIQAAIDFVAANGGGHVLVPPGVYRVADLGVPEGVHLVGADRDETVFRAWGTSSVIEPTGGWLENFTVYGTPTADRSGDGWIIGTDGEGRGGSAVAGHIIIVRNADDVHIDNVRAMESRYDCLYVRGARGLRVTNCHFDRAGRNVISMVGSDEDFVFANCYIGSHWGLYQFDIEPVDPRYVRDGLFVNCTFDGRKAGELDTNTWGSFMCFGGGSELQNRNITLMGCRFYEISVRVRGIFPGVKFLYSPVMGGPSRAFIKVRTNPVGEFRDCIVRGNRFIICGEPAEEINYEVSFTGDSVFEGNYPEKFNDLGTQEAATDTGWQEDHPVAQAPADTAADAQTTAVGADVREVKAPLMGHGFQFADGKVVPPGEAGTSDLALHIDPLMANGAAGVQLLGRGTLADFPSAPEAGYQKTLWGAGPGDVIAVRTRAGKYAVCEILELSQQEITFRYRLADD